MGKSAAKIQNDKDDVDSLSSKGQRKDGDQNKIKSSSTSKRSGQIESSVGKTRREEDDQFIRDEADSMMNDPTAFWLAWNERKKACFDDNGNPKHMAGCNCFEGMGSVM